jgi:hypothetical protein
VIVDYKYPGGTLPGQLNFDNNSYDYVKVLDPSGAGHNSVFYTSTNFPPFGSSDGKSIQLKNLVSDNSLGANWCFSTIPWQGSLNDDKGTPGAANKCTK